MIVEGLILAVIAFSKIAVAVYIAFLTFSTVVDWLQSHRKLTANDRREIGFTLQKRLANGQYNTVHGVFNKSTKQLVAARSVNSSRIDQALAGHHRAEDLAVYD